MDNKHTLREQKNPLFMILQLVYYFDIVLLTLSFLHRNRLQEQENST